MRRAVSRPFLREQKHDSLETSSRGGAFRQGIFFFPSAQAVEHMLSSEISPFFQSEKYWHTLKNYYISLNLFLFYTK